MNDSIRWIRFDSFQLMDSIRCCSRFIRFYSICNLQIQKSYWLLRRDGQTKLAFVSCNVATTSCAETVPDYSRYARDKILILCTEKEVLYSFINQRRLHAGNRYSQWQQKRPTVTRRRRLHLPSPTSSRRKPGVRIPPQ